MNREERIYASLKELRERPAGRRGPFEISDVLLDSAIHAWENKTQDARRLDQAIRKYAHDKGFFHRTVTSIYFWSAFAGSFMSGIVWSGCYENSRNIHRSQRPAPRNSCFHFTKRF